mmetsp:Transcript_152949/g.490669  ORF Transcript_152949/g.490669 Transcript_152949/m.490669 type:complete len:247 (-) Transcript_152949:136-876(-)
MSTNLRPAEESADLWIAHSLELHLEATQPICLRVVGQSMHRPTMVRASVRVEASAFRDAFLEHAMAVLERRVVRVSRPAIWSRLPKADLGAPNEHQSVIHHVLVDDHRLSSAWRGADLHCAAQLVLKVHAGADERVELRSCLPRLYCGHVERGPPAKQLEADLAPLVRAAVNNLVCRAGIEEGWRRRRQRGIGRDLPSKRRHLVVYHAAAATGHPEVDDTHPRRLGDHPSRDGRASRGDLSNLFFD